MSQRLITKTIPSSLSPLSDAQVIELADLLRLLAEPTRLRVLLACLLQPASVGEIAIRANLPRGLASHHLRLLRAGRFLRTTRNGKQMIYEPCDERVLCILADLIGHIVKPPTEEDE
jgi:ArsR family transcriptional regulator, lead/cadmium/zinc/bismuth-responsive transcriptional repressor